MRIILIVMVLVGVAHADVTPPIVVKSATKWKLVTSDTESWCQPKAGLAQGEPLTITLAAPAPIATVELRAGLGNTIGAVEVVADGTKFTSSDMTVKLAGTPVTTLVVRVTASKLGSTDSNCIGSIKLHTDPESSTVYASDAAPIADLLANVRPLREALVSCDKSVLEKLLVFPFKVGEYTEDDDGMKEKSTTYRTATKLVAACKKSQLRCTLEDGLQMSSPSAKEIAFASGDSAWSSKLVKGHWRFTYCFYP